MHIFRVRFIKELFTSTILSNFSYIDASVLNFLEEFQRNSLLIDVNMSFGNINWLIRPHILPRVLTKIAPFITSIDSIESRHIDLLSMVYTNNTNHGNINESQLLLKEMMAKTRILVTNWTNWLVVIHALLYCLFCS
jgi:hypothetical protein